MVKDRYLVVITSYINNDEKRKIVVETLKHLQQENVDVCVAMHSNQYTEDIIQYVKYLHYDYDNEYIHMNDYYENIHELNEENCSIGSNIFWMANNTGYTENYVKPEYSKPALTLFRNAVMTAYTHKYDWVIYLEYDIPIPIIGYKALIEEKINLLKKTNKSCFYYMANLYGPELIWPAILICNVQSLFNNGKELLFDSKWHLSKKDWIKQWGNAGFEYCLEHILKSVHKNDYIVENIQNDVYKVWGTYDYSNLSRSYVTRTKIKNMSVHLYPYKLNDGYKLMLMAYNCSEQNTIDYISILYDNTKVFHVENIELFLNGFFCAEMPAFNENQTITVISDGTKESFNTKDLDVIHKYLIKYGVFQSK